LIPGIIIITLLILLATKELAGASDSKPALRIARFLIVPIIPLLILFVLILALTIMRY